jgi:hypothetical protein
MKKWEYKIVSFYDKDYNNLDDSETQERMNKLGSEGWELVNFLPDLIKIYYFKREI